LARAPSSTGTGGGEAFAVTADLGASAGLGCGAASGVLAAGAAASRFGSGARSVITPLATRGVAGAAEATRGGGSGNEGAPSLRGMSTGRSTCTGRGWVSNRIGNPITPRPSSTAAPIRRRRDRARAACTGSASVAAARSLPAPD
jgi:hypothetical protein